MPKYTAVVQFPAMRIGNLEAADDAAAEKLLKQYMVRENLPNMVKQMLNAQYRASITRELEPFTLPSALPDEASSQEALEHEMLSDEEKAERQRARAEAERNGEVVDTEATEKA